MDRIEIWIQKTDFINFSCKILWLLPPSFRYVNIAIVKVNKKSHQASRPLLRCPRWLAGCLHYRRNSVLILKWPMLPKSSRLVISHQIYSPRKQPSHTGPGWDGVNFLHNSPYGAVFSIWDQTSAGNTTGFWLLLSSACTTSRLSSFLTLLLPGGRQEVGKRLGGDTAGTVDHNRPKGSSLPHSITLSNKKLGICLPVARRLAGHQSTCGRWWVTAFAQLFFHLFFTCSTVFLLLLFQFSPLCCGVGGGGKQAAVWVLSCWPGSAHNTYMGESNF